MNKEVDIEKVKKQIKEICEANDKFLGSLTYDPDPQAIIAEQCLVTRISTLFAVYEALNGNSAFLDNMSEDAKKL